jgi:hypothetical protein
MVLPVADACAFGIHKSSQTPFVDPLKNILAAIQVHFRQVITKFMWLESLRNGEVSVEFGEAPEPEHR